MFSLEPQTLIEGPGPPPIPRQRLLSAGGTHICCPLLGPSSSRMHSPLYPDISPQHVRAIPGTCGPAPGLWAGRYSPLEEVTNYRETEPDCPGLYQPFLDLSRGPHLPPHVQHIRGSDRRAPGASALERPWIPVASGKHPVSSRGHVILSRRVSEN